jgi:hypothetical protein
LDYLLLDIFALSTRRMKKPCGEKEAAPTSCP